MTTDVSDNQLWLFEDLHDQPTQIDLTGLRHYVNPQNDNERLLEYQYQYRTTGDEKALGAIFTLGYTIAYKMVNQEAKKKKQFKKLTPVAREEKATDAITYIVLSLLSKPTWYIRNSFTAYIYLRVQRELKYHRKVDTIVDFVDLEEFYKEEEDYGEIEQGCS